MIDFVTHLKDAVSNGDLAIGTSKAGDWFVLLSSQDLKDLSQKLENVKSDIQADVDSISMLVFLLCHLEGFNLFEKYKEDITESIANFDAMLNLEILKRSGHVRIYSKLSFLEDCQVEMLKPPHFGH